MNILITGGLGGVGRPLLERLAGHGHHVRVFDRTTDDCPQSVECVAGDITDFAAVREAVRGMNAVIHLAALTHPAAEPAHEIFRVNSSGTFNVYDAAAQEGIRRVVCASSINALGFNFGVRPFPIQYLPLDEVHPSFTTDAYSFSKQVVEDIGAYFHRRDGISGTQLRMPFVYTARAGLRDVFKGFFTQAQHALADFQALPEAEQEERVRRAVAEHAERRALRLSEQPWDRRGHGPGGAPPHVDPILLLIGGYSDFWAVIHGDDAAQAFEASVTADYDGSHPLYVCENRNSLGMDSEKLARLFFPNAARARPLKADESLVSIARARQLIGFAPHHRLIDWIR
jgi:nucleoside-diphosphate-sugar epimerase